MRCRYLLVIALLILASCAEKECKVDDDCSSRSSFTVSCVKGNCVQTPIPNVCGNAKCESGETKGNCADCGSCSGKVDKSKYMVWQSVLGKCVEGVPSSAVKPIIVANDVASAGDRFHVDASYSQPFNLRKDKFNFVIKFDQSLQNKDAVLLDAELSGALNRRSVVLARKTINRPLIEGVFLKESLTLELPIAELDAELSDVVLKLRYEYVSVQGEKSSRKEGNLKVSYKDKFVVVNPPSEYPCSKCDDGNPATRDFCNERNFCDSDPVPDVCGNGLCDGNENKCTCAKDCGACSGSGSITVYSCKENKCVPSLRESVVLTPSNILESRDIGPVELENNYRFTSPMVAPGKLTLDLRRVNSDPSVSKVTIETARILEGSQVISEIQVNLDLGERMSLSLPVPKLSAVEKEVSITVAVWYSYVQNEKTQSGSFQKQLGRVLIVSP